MVTHVTRAVVAPAPDMHAMLDHLNVQRMHSVLPALHVNMEAMQARFATQGFGRPVSRHQSHPQTLAHGWYHTRTCQELHAAREKRRLPSKVPRRSVWLRKLHCNLSLRGCVCCKSSSRGVPGKIIYCSKFLTFNLFFCMLPCCPRNGHFPSCFKSLLKSQPFAGRFPQRRSPRDPPFLFRCRPTAAPAPWPRPQHGRSPLRAAQHQHGGHAVRPWPRRQSAPRPFFWLRASIQSEVGIPASSACF